MDFSLLKDFLFRAFCCNLFKWIFPCTFPFIGVIPLFFLNAELFSAAIVLYFNSEDAAGASSSDAREPTVAPERGTRDSIVAPFLGASSPSEVPLAEPLIPIEDPYLELEAPVRMHPGTEEMLHISFVTTRFNQIHTLFSSYQIYALKEPYFSEDMDKGLIEAQRRGPIEFQVCFDQVQVDLDCLEREGRLHHRLYRLLSSESSLPSFFYNSPETLKDAIATSCFDSRFRPYLSLEEKLALRQDLSQLISSLQRQGRDAPIYVDALHLAKTGDLPPPRGA